MRRTDVLCIIFRKLQDNHNQASSSGGQQRRGGCRTACDKRVKCRQEGFPRVSRSHPSVSHFIQRQPVYRTIQAPSNNVSPQRDYQRDSNGQRKCSKLINKIIDININSQGVREKSLQGLRRGGYHKLRCIWKGRIFE